MKPKLAEINIQTPREPLIGHLEELLEKARSGELTGLIAVSLWQGGGAGHGWSLPAHCPVRTVIGEIEFLKRYQDDHYDSQTPEPHAAKASQNGAQARVLF